MFEKRIVLTLAIIAIAGILGLLMIDEVSGDTEVTTYRDYEHTQKAEYFTPDSNSIYYNINSDDVNGDSVTVKLEKGGSVITSDSCWIDGNGEGSGSIYSWDLDEIGECQLNIYHDDSKIGSTTAYIIGEIEIDFDKEYEEYYKPSDDVKIKIWLTDGSGTFSVKILDMNNKEVQSWSGKSIGTDKTKITYKIPDSLNDGTYEVKVFGDKHGEEISRDYQHPYGRNYTFIKITIVLKIENDHDVYIPGAKIKVYYSLSYIKTGEGVENGEYEYNLSYKEQRSSKDSYIEDKFTSSESYGSFEIELPSNVVPYFSYCELKVTGNDSEDKYSSEETFCFQIAPPKVDLEIITEQGDPKDKEGYPLYNSEDFMVVRVCTGAGPSEYWYGYEYVEDDDNNYCVFYENQYGEYDYDKDLWKYKLDGKEVWLTNSYLSYSSISSSCALAEVKVNLEINREIEKDEEYEEVSGMGKEGLETDLTGNLFYIFRFADIEPGLYTVNGTITGISGIPDKLTNGYAYFSFQKTKSMLLITKTDKEIYKPGETVNVNYTLNYPGGGEVEKATFDYRIYYKRYIEEKIVDKGRFTSGTFTFSIPEKIDSKTIY